MSADSPVILVVDDELDARETTRDLLEYEGYSVETALTLMRAARDVAVARHRPSQGDRIPRHRPVPDEAATQCCRVAHRFPFANRQRSLSHAVIAPRVSTALPDLPELLAELRTIQWLLAIGG